MAPLYTAWALGNTYKTSKYLQNTKDTFEESYQNQLLTKNHAYPAKAKE